MNSIAKIGTIKAAPILLKKQIQLNLHSSGGGGGGYYFKNIKVRVMGLTFSYSRVVRLIQIVLSITLFQKFNRKF